MKRNLLFLTSLLILSFQLNAQIVITEINYNSIGTDSGDYIELYNNGSEDVEMEGYYFAEGFEYVFPAYTFLADTYLVLAVNAEYMNETYGINALQWTSGSLGNGEDILLVDDNSVEIDYVLYDSEVGGWSRLAWGLGYSLELCFTFADNALSENWNASATFQQDFGDRSIFGSPGEQNACLANPFITPSRHTDRVVETSSVDTATFVFYLTNENGSPSSATLELDPAYTAGFDDFTVFNQELQFDGAGEASILVQYAIIDDAVAEPTETLIFNISAGDNVEAVLQDQITVYIYDNDTPLKEDLVIAGVFDADATEDFDNYGVELFAINDIPDLSIYSVGTANNGGGTDGIEIPLPAISLERGERFFISDSETRFSTFFSVYSDLQHPEIFITGDDAVELFEHGQVIDVFGEIAVDGTGTDWEFANGWAVRLPETGPDGSTFNIANWTFSGINQLQGVVNEICPTPYPFNFYMVSPTKNIYSQLDFELVPTLVDQELFVNISEAINEKGTVSIFNALGQLLFHSTFDANQSQIKIDLSNFDHGQYYLNLATDDGVGTRKFVKG